MHGFEAKIYWTDKHLGTDPVTLSIKLSAIVMQPCEIIVNVSFATGKFPDALKDAIISPIIKKQTLDPNIPGGFTLHMTGYAPACTKSVEKGCFLDIRWRRRLLQKGYIFGR